MWYTSGIESFISTMETSSLMGMNVARLIADGWKTERDNRVLVVEMEKEGKQSLVQEGKENAEGVGGSMGQVPLAGQSTGEEL